MISTLNENNRRGSRSAPVPFTNANLSFLSFLRRQGFIASYEVLNLPPKGSIRVRFRLMGSRNPFHWIYLVPRNLQLALPRNPLFYPHFAFMAGSLGVVETPLGLVTYSEARALELPSRLLFRIAV